MDSADVDLVSEDGPTGRLVISRLPTGSDGPEIAERGGVVIREGRIYRFQIEIKEPIARLEPSELFDVDDASRATGRLSPGEAVGLVRLELTTASGSLLRGTFDVRSTKFSDEQAFGTMLADLASMSVEALHQGFSPSAGRFGTDSGPAPRLLYQQFAVLHGLLIGSDLRWALTQLLAQPHHAWHAQFETRQPGRPLRGSSRLRTQLSRPGPRVPTLAGPLPSLPQRLLVERTDETLDTVPNRFVHFALERWRALAAAVVQNASELRGAAMRRGVAEAQGVVEQLDEFLYAPMFREVGRLSVFPGDNQVLRRREGYRQIFAAAALIEGALGLDLDLEDPFLVSRRSIATLYEYWTFVRLAKSVAEACRTPSVARDLFRPSGNGMSLVLRADASTRLRFQTRVGEEEVFVDLFFNRQFNRDSWTRPMRPDASMVVRKPGDQEVWLHFDAKYRVDWSTPFQTGNAADEEDAERVGSSKRTDLLKMHAYRDAIRDSAGSYVLFPGTDTAEFTVNAFEFLPGLGAFPLRPDRAEEDATTLTRFVSRVLTHVAGEGTRHRRATYWTSRAYKERGTPAPEARPPAGELPPADTPVLLGYVRSDQQWLWVRQVGLYNVRGGQRPGAVVHGGNELNATLLLLYGREAGAPKHELYERTGGWESLTGQALQRLGYPNPRGDSYLVTGLRLLPSPPWLDEVEPSRLLPTGWLTGRPFTTTWLDVVLSTQDREA